MGDEHPDEPRWRRVAARAARGVQRLDEHRWRRVAARAARGVQRLDEQPTLLKMVRFMRERLPGDSEFGDSLSTAGGRQIQVAGRRLSDMTARRPGVLREAGLSALQVWEAVSEAQGRGRGERELAIVFTDLVAFSDWALEAGDDAAVRLLRAVDAAFTPAIEAHGGEVVKRLGDGMMAVFANPREGVRAVAEGRERLAACATDGYVPRARAGMHVGRPRRLGGDYFGVDVTIAARLAEEAAPDELLVSDAVLARLGDGATPPARRKRRFKVKGVPKDLSAYALSDPG